MPIPILLLTLLAADPGPALPAIMARVAANQDRA